jgi:hypothetical protein
MHKYLWFLAPSLLIAVVAFAQISPPVGSRVQRSAGTAVVRAASGALSVAETTAGFYTAPFREARYTVDITTITPPDADDVVDFYFQVSYDGTNWCDNYSSYWSIGNYRYDRYSYRLY